LPEILTHNWAMAREGYNKTTARRSAVCGIITTED